MIQGDVPANEKTHYRRMFVCKICNTALKGRQTKNCGLRCKNEDTNHRFQAYRAQQQRGRRRKAELVRRKGERCGRCGYCRNMAALEFHHRDPRNKSFALDLRSLSYRSWQDLEAEADKCDPLCSNCHKELHNPDWQVHK